MADINVERKKPGIWPWIIGLIVVALLVWALTRFFDDGPPEVDATGQEPIGMLIAPPGR